MKIREYATKVAWAAEKIDDGSVEAAIQALIKCRKKGGIVWVMGNGGSFATALHFVNDLVKLARTKKKDRGVEAVCVGANIAETTAYGNDLGYHEIFSMPIGQRAKKVDVVVGITTSGGSQNIYNGLMVAKEMIKCETVLITGDTGGICAQYAGIMVNVENMDIRIAEDLHTIICHHIAGELRDRDE